MLTPAKKEADTENELGNTGDGARGLLAQAANNIAERTDSQSKQRRGSRSAASGRNPTVREGAA